MKEFIILTKGQHHQWNEFSADEKQKLMEKYISFVNRLKRESRFKGGSALAGNGYSLKNKNGIVISDGPFAETKEVLNGYLIIEAESMDEAVAIARDCPALTHGENLEVYEMN